MEKGFFILKKEEKLLINNEIQKINNKILESKNTESIILSSQLSNNYSLSLKIFYEELNSKRLDYINELEKIKLEGE
ncbi:MAG: hypothetical protein PHC65_05220 [Methanobacteriaceae archaeon]|uniref:hypothetical protein n=1 Tax=Methanobrevibacter sp. UBA46 TaxID=1915488 RepID=UPI00375E1922|nr:hypothetical protein [Methanobacteriaceae archaeon]MDD4594415.1 hypothetical protein [Methanobacteriaceae archaeon]